MLHRMKSSDLKKTDYNFKKNNSTPKQIFLMIHYCNLFIIFEKFFPLQLKIVQKHSGNKHTYKLILNHFNKI